MNEIRKSILIERKVNITMDSPFVMVELSIFLDVFVLCQQTTTLPREGGLLDQDSLYVHLMRHALVCQDEKRQLEEFKRQREVPHAI